MAQAAKFYSEVEDDASARGRGTATARTRATCSVNGEDGNLCQCQTKLPVRCRVSLTFHSPLIRESSDCGNRKECPPF